VGKSGEKGQTPPKGEKSAAKKGDTFIGKVAFLDFSRPFWRIFSPSLSGYPHHPHPVDKPLWIPRRPCQAGFCGVLRKKVINRDVHRKKTPGRSCNMCKI